MKKMVMAIVPRDEAELVLNALISAGYTATFTETQGGMLREAQLALFSVVKEEHLEIVLGIIRDNCRVQVTDEPIKNADGWMSLGSIPVTKGSGGAIVFIWEIGRIETY